MSTATLILDSLMVILLAATVGYASVLNRRLAAWRKDKAELEKLIDRFNRAAQHADVGISTLKAASEATGRALSQTTTKAQSLCDDLAFLIERAEPLADRMTAGASRLRTASPANDPPIIAPETAAIAEAAAAPREEEAMRASAPAFASPRPAAASLVSAPGRTAAERNLLKALSALR